MKVKTQKDIWLVICVVCLLTGVSLMADSSLQFFVGLCFYGLAKGCNEVLKELDEKYPDHKP